MLIVLWGLCVTASPELKHTLCASQFRLIAAGIVDGNLVVAVGIKICNCNLCWTSWRDVTAARRRRGLKAEDVSGLKHFIEQPFTPSLSAEVSAAVCVI